MNPIHWILTERWIQCHNNVMTIFKFYKNSELHIILYDYETMI